ncbi:unnamed protein product [Absidia cylindrospora]
MNIPLLLNENPRTLLIPRTHSYFNNHQNRFRNTSFSATMNPNSKNNLLSVIGTPATKPSLDDPILQDTDVFTQMSDHSLCNWPGCTKQFIQRSALTVHYRTHSGERPHICEQPLCKKAFSDSSSLARHRRIHSGTRPYTCDRCEKSFTRKTTLSKHRIACQTEKSPNVLVFSSSHISTSSTQSNCDSNSLHENTSDLLDSPNALPPYSLPYYPISLFSYAQTAPSIK